MKEISGRYPRDKNQLLDISGVGSVKFNKYGEDILKIVNEYLEEKNMHPIWQDKKKLKIVIDGDSRKNNEIALDLLNQGKELYDVSLDMEVSQTTLLTYVNEYILEGNVLNFDLKLNEYYGDNEKGKILKAMKECKSQNLNLIKNF